MTSPETAELSDRDVPVHDLRLPATDARAVLLVRAVETVDRRGDLLSHERRREATRAARAEKERGWLRRRARDLLAGLDRRAPFVPRYRRITDPGRGLFWPAVLVGLILGLATNALGPERQIHVLALPLATLLLWNVAVLLLLVARRLLPLPSAWRDHRPRLLGLFERYGFRLASLLPKNASGGTTGETKTSDADLWRRVLTADLETWFQAVAPLAAARLRRLLHAGALALLVGVVAGMYLRGIVFEYRASWESTFLDGATVDRVLGAVLGPAAALLGTAVPSAAALSEIPGDAAPWLHLWALTAAIFVGVPRLAFLVVETLTIARLARRLPIEVSGLYVRRLLAAVSTSEHHVDVWPYSYHPPAGVADRLRALLHDVFGARARIRVRPFLDYGAEPDPDEPAGGRGIVVLLSLAQTPEVEVHGELLETLRDSLADGQSLVVLVDASAFRAKVPPGEAGVKRLEERRRAWDRVASGAGVAAVHIDLRESESSAAVAAMVAGAWPEGSLD